MSKLSVVPSIDDGVDELSEARSILDRHRQRVDEARNEVSRLSRPFDRLRAEDEAARLALADCDAAFRAIEDAEACDLRAWSERDDGSQMPGLRQSQRDAAQARLDEARGVVDRLGWAIADADAQRGEAIRALMAVQSGTDALILAVLVDEASAPMARLESARAAVVAAEADVAGVIQLIGDRGMALREDETTKDTALPWLRARETLRNQYDASPAPFLTDQIGRASADRWKAFAKQLVNDAGAKREVDA